MTARPLKEDGFSSLPYLSPKFISVDVGRGLQTPPDGPSPHIYASGSP
jgi:hypothetical protein